VEYIISLHIEFKPAYLYLHAEGSIQTLSESVDGIAF